jgi:hypothetical protein
MRRWIGIVILLFGCSASVLAQEPVSPSAASVEELKALVFVLQTRLVTVEQELGREKARRAELELAELQRARETLDPGVKKRLGLPVPDAPKTEKPVTPQTPPKE